MVVALFGKAAPGATDTPLHRIPVGEQFVCSLLNACNRTAGALTIRIGILRAGETTMTDSGWLVYDGALAPNSTVDTCRGVTLSENDTFIVRASSTGVSFQVFGEQTTIP